MFIDNLFFVLLFYVIEWSNSFTTKCLDTNTNTYVPCGPNTSQQCDISWNKKASKLNYSTPKFHIHDRTCNF